MQTAEFISVFDQFGSTFASELRDGEQVIGVAAVEVDFNDIVHLFALLLFEGRERVGAHVRSIGERLLSNRFQRIGKLLLSLCKLLELNLVKVDITGRLLTVLMTEIVDVARDHDGEQEEGGRPFASGKMELRFHGCKDTISRYGLSRYLQFIY